MAFNSNRSLNEHMQIHNPWERFKTRNEQTHLAEDSRLVRAASTTSLEVIKNFITYGTHQFEEPIPQQRQLLRDYLCVAATNDPDPTNQFVETDIVKFSKTWDIALLDDRQNHDGCARPYGNPCSRCHIFSENLSIPQLFLRLKENRKSHKAEKRIIFIPNLTSAAALALAATVANRTALPLRNFLHRYLGREHHFSVFTPSPVHHQFWGFSLEFHIPYYAMRLLKKETNQTKPVPIKDKRTLHDKPLRASEVLPLGKWSPDGQNLYFYEAQTSSLSIGPDEWFWTEYFLVDTYFGSEHKLHNYLSNCPPGNGSDFPLGGGHTMAKPCFDPREYFLLKVERRIFQATVEYTALIETFDKRMEEYGADVRRIFEDDEEKTHTQTISNVIETCQLFVDCISGTLGAWENFSRQQLSFFTIFAQEKLDWPYRIDSITRNMTELDRLRKLLLTKRERFQFKLDSLHTVSSLKQSRMAILQSTIAVQQGENIKTLTQMTVYIAFPLLFTTALFSMDIMHPPYPWLVFFAVLILVTVVTYAVAPYVSRTREWLDSKIQSNWSSWHS